MEKGIVNINTDQENLFLGNHLQELVDQTTATFDTDDLESFNKYLDDTPVFVFVGSGSISAYNKPDKAVILKPAFNENPIAVCSLSYSPLVKLFEGINGKAMPLIDFQNMLDKLRMFMGENELHLKDMIRSFSMNKIVDVERTSDTRGNVLHKIQIEDGKGKTAAKKDTHFPETVGFKVPLFAGMPDMVELKFDLVFEWAANSDGDLKLLFTLNNFLLSEQLKELKKTLVAEKLNKQTYKVISGSVKVFNQTDAWQYMKNELVIKDK